jgi:menaquinone-9 beta-reductase
MRVRDVVIVGGGPAGSATGLLLARAGFDVMILDRADFPRVKACGDCISPGANAVLRRLGVWDAVRAKEPARLRGWRLSCVGDVCFDTAFSGEAGLAVDRRELDSVLLEAARSAGVSVQTGTPLLSLMRATDGQVIGANDLRARVVVGADGLRSKVARLLDAYRRAPRLRKLSLTAHVRGVPDISDMGEMHVDGAACLGIAPVQSSADPLCNVTVVLRSGIQYGRGPHETMRMGLQRFAQRDLSGLITDHVPISASGPFDWPTRRIVFDGAALVGDAAGYYDPFTGQGIYQALAGAEILADELVRALDCARVGARQLLPYEKRLRALTEPARRVQRAIEYVCAHPRLARVMFAKFARAPLCADQLIAVTGDTTSPSALFSAEFVGRLLAA